MPACFRASLSALCFVVLAGCVAPAPRKIFVLHNMPRAQADQISATCEYEADKATAALIPSGTAGFYSRSLYRKCVMLHGATEEIEKEQ